MELATIPFSTSDFGWLCLAAAILVGTVVLVQLLIAPSRARAPRAAVADAGSRSGERLQASSAREPARSAS